MQLKTQFKLGLASLAVLGLLSWYEGWNPQKIVGSAGGTDYLSAGSRKRLANAKDEPNTAAIELTFNPNVPHSDDEPEFNVTWALNSRVDSDHVSKQGLWFRTFGVKPGDVILVDIKQNKARYTFTWDATIWHVRATGGVGDSCHRGGFAQSCTLKYVVR